ncbi:MAG: hypothetical protein U9R79_05965 [Armatimonadota bacterium]|nr:hypothetical protein [Armatimonadota bacterium]
MSIAALGVDTGINRTALAVREDGGIECVSSVARPRVGAAESALMIRAVREAVRSALWSAGELTTVAMERLVFGRGTGLGAHLSLEWAVVEGALEALRLAAGRVPDPEALQLVVCRPAPTQLKKFVTGRGDTRKSEVGRFIERRWPQAPEEEDEAEAYALLKFAQCRREFELGQVTRDDAGDWTQFQVDLAARDLWSERKDGNLETLTVTGADALELAAEFRAAWTEGREVAR